MTHTGGCSSPKQATSSKCHAIQDIQTVQPFPTNGVLAKNLRLPLPVVKGTIRKDRGRAYSYVVRTVKLDHETTRFGQHGSAPNFQGDVLTLCTCKHQMRASQSAADWPGVWIAGFTSRTIHDGRNWLFYLARIVSAFGSHADLWAAMNVNSRKAKAAHTHFLGDLFQPKTPHPAGKARFLPTRYVTPSVHAHRQHDGDKGWHNDIHYRHAPRYGQPPLLVADPQQTFVWDEPMIFFTQKHCRNFYKWASLSELVAQLRKEHS